MINDVMENAIGGLIASETHGLIALLLCRISEELKLAWGFQAELEELQDQLTFLSELINGASCQPVTSSWVRKWLNKIKDAAEEADDLVDEWSYETLKSRLQTRKRDKLIRGVTYPVARLVMAHRVRDLRKSISNIYNDAQKNGINPIKVAIGHYNNKSSQGDSQQRRPQYRQWVGDELLLGRDEDITNLVSLLCDPSNKKSDLNVIGIVGLAGLGKTALSKRVSKLSEVTSLFNSMLFIRCEGMKTWKRALTKQHEQLRKENDSNKEFYHHEREQLQIKMQLTIESQQAELFKKEQAAYALAESHKRLQGHNAQLEKERVAALEKAEEAESRRVKEVDELNSKLSQLTIEKENKEAAVQRAYEKAFPEADFEWFARRLNWAETAIAAEAIGQPAPELEESEDEGGDGGEEEGADVDDGATPDDAA